MKLLKITLIKQALFKITDKFINKVHYWNHQPQGQKNTKCFLIIKIYGSIIITKLKSIMPISMEGMK